MVSSKCRFWQEAGSEIFRDFGYKVGILLEKKKQFSEPCVVPVILATGRQRQEGGL